MLMGCVMGTILPSQLLHMATASAAAAGSGVAAAVTGVGVGVGRGYRHYRTLAGKESLHVYGCVNLCLCVLHCEKMCYFICF